MDTSKFYCKKVLVDAVLAVSKILDSCVEMFEKRMCDEGHSFQTIDDYLARRGNFLQFTELQNVSETIKHFKI